MSRNSKNAQRVMMARSFRRAKAQGAKHVATGNKGPARTEPKHGKNNAWFQQYDSHGEFMASQKKGKRKGAEARDEE